MLNIAGKTPLLTIASLFAMTNGCSRPDEGSTALPPAPESLVASPFTIEINGKKLTSNENTTIDPRHSPLDVRIKGRFASGYVESSQRETGPGATPQPAIIETNEVRRSKDGQTIHVETNLSIPDQSQLRDGMILSQHTFDGRTGSFSFPSSSDQAGDWTPPVTVWLQIDDNPKKPGDVVEMMLRAKDGTPAAISFGKDGSFELSGEWEVSPSLPTSTEMKVLATLKREHPYEGESVSPSGYQRLASGIVQFTPAD